MQGTQGRAQPGNGRAATAGGSPPRSVEIASGGIRETQDYKDLFAAIAEDVLTGSLSHKTAGPVVRSVLGIIRVMEFEQRHANGESVQGSDSRRPRGQEPDHNAALAKREADLLEELAAVRKERAAG